MGSKSKYSANEVVRDLYMEWLRYPDAASRMAKGLPGTKGCFAKQNHISRSQLWRYEQDFDFQRQLMQPVQNIITADDWQAILLAQKNKALDGNVQAARFIRETLGFGSQKLPERPEEDEHERELSRMSESELEAYLTEHDDG